MSPPPPAIEISTPLEIIVTLPTAQGLTLSHVLSSSEALWPRLLGLYVPVRR